jgi:hypothetical protein
MVQHVPPPPPSPRRRPSPGRWQQALIHNGDVLGRGIAVEVAAQPGARGSAARFAVHVVGGREAFEQLREPGRFVLPAVEPTGNRWIAVTVDTETIELGDSFALHFREVLDERTMNGFTIRFVGADAATCIRENLRRHAWALRRLAHAWRLKAAAKGIKPSVAASRDKKLSDKRYIELLRDQWQLLDHGASKIRDGLGHDPVDLHGALLELRASLDANELHGLLDAHANVVQKLDAAMTMAQKRGGDPADIAQTVRWERRLIADLATRNPKLAKTGSMLKNAAKFEAEFARKRSAARLYPAFLKSEVSMLATLSKELKDDGLRERAGALKKAVSTKSLASMQRAHRDLLLELARVVR